MHHAFAGAAKVMRTGYSFFFNAVTSTSTGADGAWLLNIIALCNSLGLCGGVAGADYIRCGYVKLLGSNFLWRSFLLVRRDAALGLA